MEELKPISISEIADGKYILDMGQKHGGLGHPQRAPRQEGSTHHPAVRETLKPDGTLYMDNLRGAKVTDIYTPAKDGPISWEPSFVFHGFRFVEINGLDYQPELSNFTGKVIYDKMETTGQFESSNETINQLVKNAFWAYGATTGVCLPTARNVTSDKGGSVTALPAATGKRSCLTTRCSTANGYKTSRIRKAPKGASRWYHRATGPSITTT